jgi:hypothetical protein
MKKLPRGVFNLFDLFEDESDRAAVVLAGAYVDTLLEELLRSWLDPDSHHHLKPPNGFLSSFGSRVNVAHAIGAVPKPVRDRLKAVAGIRNHFAHNVMHAEWTHPDVQKQLGKLAAPQAAFSTDRGRFLSNVTTLSLVLRNSRLRAPERRKLDTFIWKIHDGALKRASANLKRLRRPKRRRRGKLA